jgi:ribonuclease HI
LGGITGEIFIDGSCTASPIRGLARAGSTAVEVGEDGSAVREMSINIPAAVAQTAQAAEYGGYYLVLKCLTDKANVYTDCLGVKQASGLDADKLVDPRRKHGATVLAAHADPEQRGRCKAVQWVKAHRCIDSAANDRDRWLIKGNGEADAAAKRAVQLHAQPAPEVAAEVEHYCSRFPLVARAVGTALALFPPAPGNLKRHPPPKTRE